MEPDTIDRLLTLKEVKIFVPKGKTTIYRWMKQGRFPQSVKKCGSTFWRYKDIQDFIRGSNCPDNPPMPASS